MLTRYTSTGQRLGMPRFLIGIAVLALLFLDPSSPVRADHDDDGKPKVVSPHDKVAGLTYGEWGAAWWQWLLPIAPCSTGFDPNHPTVCAGTPAPTLDPTGDECAVDQSGPVWFLAGTSYNTLLFGPPKRKCTVPAGKHIFFPIVNVIDDWPCPPAFNFNPPPGRSLEDYLTQDAANIIGGVTALEVTVDGVPMKQPFKYRATSQLVGFTAEAGWQFNDPCVTGTPQVGVADGYWIMLRPLPGGKHTLHFRGGFPGFETEVFYDLTVAH